METQAQIQTPICAAHYAPHTKQSAVMIGVAFLGPSGLRKTKDHPEETAAHPQQVHVEAEILSHLHTCSHINTRSVGTHSTSHSICVCLFLSLSDLIGISTGDQSTILMRQIIISGVLIKMGGKV